MAVPSLVSQSKCLEKKFSFVVFCIRARLQASRRFVENDQSELLAAVEKSA